MAQQEANEEQNVQPLLLVNIDPQSEALESLALGVSSANKCLMSVLVLAGIEFIFLPVAAIFWI